MISLLLSLLVVGLICYLIVWVMNRLGVPDPIRTIVTVIMVVVVALWLISLLIPLGGSGLRILR